MHNAILLCFALAVPAFTGAQVLELPKTREPALWTSLSAGFFDAQSVTDGRTSSVWDFSSALQYRASIELPLQRGATAGASVTYARMPLTYYAQSGAPIGGCTSGCDAHADLWSLMGLFHIGGGDGFHQVIDIAAGVTRYANFEADDGGGTLPPEHDTDVALAVGYGFGYSFGRRLHVMLVQDFSVSLHQDDGLSGSTSRTAQQRTTRLGIRYGVGSRTRY